MARYQVRYASTFFKDMDKLDREAQKIIAKQIDKHLVNVDFPKVPGKYLSGNFSGYVRFRVSSYQIIAKVDNEDFVFLNVHLGKRSEVYRFRWRD